MSGISSDFDYGGQLVFNSIRATEVQEGDSEGLKGQLRSELVPRFERGNPDDATEGFSDIEIAAIANLQEEIEEEELIELAENLIDQKHIDETYAGLGKTEIVDDDGDTVSAWVRNANETYVYWDYPDYLFVQGADQKAQDTTSEVNVALGESVSLEEIVFDPDFLLWLLYRYQAENESIPGAITPTQLSASETYGELEDFGKRTRVNESDNIARSVPLIAAILHNMDLRMLEGDFDIDTPNDTYSVTAQLKSPGRVHVKVAGDIDDAKTKCRRALIALLFMREFTDLYHNIWKGLDPQDKYPPLDFFDDLVGVGIEEDADFSEYDFTGLAQEYLRKREENISQYSFTHLTD